MSASKSFIKKWISVNGPYLYHGISQRNKELSLIMKSIFEDGILPDMREPDSWPEWSEEEAAAGFRTDANYDLFDDWLEERWHYPRPGCVFMVTHAGYAYGETVVQIDMRYLDESNFVPDDDFIRDFCPEKITHHKQHVPPISLGEQVDLYNWSSQEDTESSFKSHGVIGYKGTVPATALKLLDSKPEYPRINPTLL